MFFNCAFFLEGLVKDRYLQGIFYPENKCFNFLANPGSEKIYCSESKQNKKNVP